MKAVNNKPKSVVFESTINKIININTNLNTYILFYAGSQTVASVTKLIIHPPPAEGQPATDIFDGITYDYFSHEDVTKPNDLDNELSSNYDSYRVVDTHITVEPITSSLSLDGVLASYDITEIQARHFTRAYSVYGLQQHAKIGMGEVMLNIQNSQPGYNIKPLKGVDGFDIVLKQIKPPKFHRIYVEGSDDTEEQQQATEIDTTYNYKLLHIYGNTNNIQMSITCSYLYEAIPRVGKDENIYIA